MTSATFKGSLNKRRDEALRIMVEHGFTEASVPEDLMLMASEASEALEDHRNSHAPNHVWYEEKPYPKPDPRCQIHYYMAETVCTCRAVSMKPCGIPSEMADVVLRVLHFSGKHEIDIQHAVATLEAHMERTGKAFEDGTVPEDLMRIVAELGKALDDFDSGLLKHIMYRDLDGRISVSWTSEPMGVPMKLAGVILRVIHFCEKHDVDIEKAVTEKNEFNMSRPFKHGNKVI